MLAQAPGVNDGSWAAQLGARQEVGQHVVDAAPVYCSNGDVVVDGDGVYLSQQPSKLD